MPYLLEVEWIDSTTYNGWKLKEDADKLKCFRIQSSGYFVKRNGQNVILAMNHSLEDEDVSMCTVIPRGCITDVRFK